MCNPWISTPSKSASIAFFGSLCVLTRLTSVFSLKRHCFWRIKRFTKAWNIPYAAMPTVLVAFDHQLISWWLIRQHAIFEAIIVAFLCTALCNRFQRIELFLCINTWYSGSPGSLFARRINDNSFCNYLASNSIRRRFLCTPLTSAPTAPVSLSAKILSSGAIAIRLRRDQVPTWIGSTTLFLQRFFQKIPPAFTFVPS